MGDLLSYLSYYLPQILVVTAIVFLLTLIFKRAQRRLHSHWNTLLQDFQFSSIEFYKLLKDELKSKGVHDMQIKEVKHPEGGIFSRRRIYLRVKWKEYYYDCCCAPFAKGTFISWWLIHRSPLRYTIISKIPFIGTSLAERLFPVTFYKHDTASMFMSFAQSSVLNVIDEITKDENIRLSTSTPSKPIVNHIFTRK